jgi:hypothetical protein
MSNSQKAVLATSGTAAAAQKWPGGTSVFIVEASGSGNVVLQIQAPTGTWIPFATLTATGQSSVVTPAGQVRCVITGLTGVNAWLIRP